MGSCSKPFFCIGLDNVAYPNFVLRCPSARPFGKGYRLSSLRPGQSCQCLQVGSAHCVLRVMRLYVLQSLELLQGVAAHREQRRTVLHAVAQTTSHSSNIFTGAKPRILPCGVVFDGKASSAKQASTSR
eukprot:6452303-Amphidinium_carterae.1